MRFDWRAILGPVLTAATALTAILLDHGKIASSGPFEDVFRQYEEQDATARAG